MADRVEAGPRTLVIAGLLWEHPCPLTQQIARQGALRMKVENGCVVSLDFKLSDNQGQLLGFFELLDAETIQFAVLQFSHGPKVHKKSLPEYAPQLVRISLLGRKSYLCPDTLQIPQKGLF